MLEQFWLKSIVLTTVAAAAGGAVAWRAATVAGGQAVKELQARDVDCQSTGDVTLIICNRGCLFVLSSHISI
jgi:hypothetical protein